MPDAEKGRIRRRYCFYGQVQGVGFRYRAKYAAELLDLTGWVENQWDGSVLAEVQGPKCMLDRWVPTISAGSHWIQIEQTECKEVPLHADDSGFHVRG